MRDEVTGLSAIRVVASTEVKGLSASDLSRRNRFGCGGARGRAGRRCLWWHRWPDAVNLDLAALVDGRQRRDHGRIQAFAHQLVDDVERLQRIARLLVRTVRSQGIERISHGDYPRHQRNLIAFQSVRITAPVERFMVQFDPGQHVLQLPHRAQDVRAPVSGPVVDLGGRDGGGKSGWARFRVFEAGAVDTPRVLAHLGDAPDGAANGPDGSRRPKTGRDLP